MARTLRSKTAGWLGTVLLVLSAAAPLGVRAQAYLLPAFKECLAKAAKGGKDAPTRSECYWQHQEAQSDNGP